MSELTETDSPQYQPGQLKEIVHSILKEAAESGASAAEAGISIESGLNVTVRMGEVETVEHNRDKGMGVTVYFGKRKGTSSTTDFSPKALEDTVRAACSIARYTAEDEFSGLADARLMATDIPDLDLCHPWKLSMDEAVDMATRCEAAARELDARIINSEGATLSSHQAYRAYANSHGFCGGYASTSHSLSCAVIGQDADGQGGMQRDYWYDVSRDRSQLDSAESIGQTAARRTLRRLNGRRIRTMQTPVIFAADIANGFWGHFISAIRGSSLYRQSSFLLDHLGKQVFSDNIHIQEQPHLKGAMGSAPFDSEGVATRQRLLVEDGILQGYVLDSYSARKLGMTSTGNAGGVHNLLIRPGEHDLEGLLKEMDTGLLLTEVMGQGVNIVTGDYSRGATGFWVEAGEIQYPVEEITVAGNLKELFMSVAAVGNDVETRSNIRTGSVLVDGMTVAGE
ncbi:MAG: metalloprotease PmbA [Gammaproteobacteria bacterium]|nr:MAG: metalloprotease PmbA [Gammaproteobacteria bacterium]